MTRHTASSITDAQLDALYAELRITESLRANADYHLGREMARSRRAEQRTEEQRARAEQAEAELEQYATGMAGPVRWSVYNEMHGRALSAEGNLKDAEERAEQADFRTKLWIAQAQDNAKEAIDAQQRAEQAEAALDRIRDAARLHRQGLIDTELYAVIEAHTTPAPAASGTPPTEPCTDPRHTGRIREQLGCVGPAPAATDVDRPLTPEQQIRGVQTWMAMDIHQALGWPVDHTTTVEHQGRQSWGDWWAELCQAVRELAVEATERYAAEVATEDQEPGEEPARCTCGDAGDAFVPSGHYRDCPAATEATDTTPIHPCEAAQLHIGHAPHTIGPNSFPIQCPGYDPAAPVVVTDREAIRNLLNDGS